jgi:hypothetical protein
MQQMKCQQSVTFWCGAVPGPRAFFPAAWHPWEAYEFRLRATSTFLNSLLLYRKCWVICALKVSSSCSTKLSLYLSILLHYFTYSNTVFITMQLTTLYVYFPFTPHYMFRPQSAIIRCYLSRQNCYTVSNDSYVWCLIHQLHCSLTPLILIKISLFKIICF